MTNSESSRSGRVQNKGEAWNVYGWTFEEKFYLGPASGVVFIPIGEKCADFRMWDLEVRIAKRRQW